MSDLPEGDYTFTVRARDNGGLETTQTRTFSIDATPPDVTINSGPSQSWYGTKETTATFTFSSTEGGTGVFCRVEKHDTWNDSLYEQCSGNGTHTVSGLDSGTYTFGVRAVDEFGNNGYANYTWIVDATAPTVTGVNPSDGSQGVAKSTNVTATFPEWMDEASVEAAGTFTLSRQDGTAVAATVSYDSGTATLDPTADLDPSAT